MRVVSMSTALKMLLVIYLPHNTWFNSSSRVCASCERWWRRAGRRRPSLVRYFSAAFCFPVLFLCLLVPRPSQGSEAWTALAVPAPRRDGGAGVRRGQVPAPAFASRVRSEALSPFYGGAFSALLAPGTYQSLPRPYFARAER